MGPNESYSKSGQPRGPVYDSLLQSPPGHAKAPPAYGARTSVTAARERPLPHHSLGAPSRRSGIHRAASGRALPLPCGNANGSDPHRVIAPGGRRGLASAPWSRGASACCFHSLLVSRLGAQQGPHEADRTASAWTYRATRVMVRGPRWLHIVTNSVLHNILAAHMHVSRARPRAVKCQLHRLLGAPGCAVDAGWRSGRRPSNQRRFLAMRSLSLSGGGTDDGQIFLGRYRV